MKNGPKHAIMSNQLIGTRKSQSALEYMMTYGWAILIIVIVAVILYSMGIFNPSSSISSTVTGFSGLGSVTAYCVPNEGLILSLGDSTGVPIKIISINSTFLSSKFSASYNNLILPGASGIFLIPQACPKKASTPFSAKVSINYLEPGQSLEGPYTSIGHITSDSISDYSYIGIAMAGSNATQIISSFSNTVVKSFYSVYPYFLMPSENYSEILFRGQSNQLSIVNTTTLKISRNITIPNVDQAVFSKNGSYVYAVNGTSNYGDLVVYSINSRSVQKVIPVPTNCISTLALSNQGNIYLSIETGWSSCGPTDQNSIIVVSPSEGKIIKNITGLSYPIFLQVINNTIWTGNWFSDTVSVINTSSNYYITNITTGSSPQAIDYSSGKVYITVVHSPNSSLLVLNPETFKLLNNITLPNIFGLQVPGVAVAQNGIYTYHIEIIPVIYLFYRLLLML